MGKRADYTRWVEDVTEVILCAGPLRIQFCRLVSIPVKAYIEEQVGPLISAAGVGWAVYHGTYVAHDIAQGFTAVYLKSGPLEVAAIGILVWLHGKYRRATNMNR